MLFCALLGTQLSSAEPSPNHYNTLHAKIETNRFKISIYTPAQGIPFNKIHTWRLQIESKLDSPEPAMNIEVKGGMKRHKHGLTTLPQVNPGKNPGEYFIKGLKFHMRGAWFIQLLISENKINILEIEHFFDVDHRQPNESSPHEIAF